MINLSSVGAEPRFRRYMDDGQHLRLLQLGRRKFVARKDYVFHAGDPATCVCLVESGRFKILHPIPGGREMLVFFRSSGDLLGLRGSLQLSGTGIRSYSAQACEDSEILCITTDVFRSYLLAHPQIALCVVGMLARRLDDTCGIFSNLAMAHVPSRVACLLLHMGGCYGEHDGHGVKLNTPLTQQEIADMVGAARQTVSSILATLKERGVISEFNKRLRIENAAELQDIARGGVQLHTLPESLSESE